MNKFIKIHLRNASLNEVESYNFLCDCNLFNEWLELCELDCENNAVQEIESYFRAKAWDFNIEEYNTRLKRVNKHISNVVEYCKRNPDLDESKAVLYTLESYTKDAVLNHNCMNHYSRKYLLSDKFFSWFDEVIKHADISLSASMIRFFNDKKDKIVYENKSVIQMRLDTLKNSIKKAHIQNLEKMIDRFIQYPIVFLFKTGYMEADEFQQFITGLQEKFNFAVYQDAIHKNSFNIQQQKILTEVYSNFITSQHKQIIYYREFV